MTRVQALRRALARIEKALPQNPRPQAPRRTPAATAGVGASSTFAAAARHLARGGDLSESAMESIGYDELMRQCAMEDR